MSPWKRFGFTNIKSVAFSFRAIKQAAEPSAQENFEEGSLSNGFCVC
jgi:hypothetical protein